MKIIIEAEISDTEAEKLEEIGYDVNYPFSTNVTLDYGDKVIYGNFGKIWKIWENKSFFPLDILEVERNCKEDYVMY